MLLRRPDCLVLQTVDRSFQFCGILTLLDRVIKFLLLDLLAVDLEQSKVFLICSLSVHKLALILVGHLGQGHPLVTIPSIVWVWSTQFG